MKFSIIVPVYSREEYIKTVLESVVKQRGDWELLIVDDGSLDKTGNICREYADNDTRIKYIYQDNAGVCVARNLGIKYAEGDYIVFLDSDNTLKENALEVLEKNISNTELVDIMCYGFDSSSTRTWVPEFVDEKALIRQETIRSQYLPTHMNLNSQEHYFLKNYIWNKAYRRVFLLDNNLFFDESRRIWEDGLFVVNCLDKCCSILLIAESIYNAYCDQAVEHLSSNWFEFQLMQYIKDEQGFKDRFSTEFGFDTAHYIRSNFNILKLMLERTVNNFGEKSIPIIAEAIKHPLVMFWISNIPSLNNDDECLIKYIRSGNPKKVYGYLKPSVFKRIVRRLSK